MLNAQLAVLSVSKLIGLTWRRIELWNCMNLRSAHRDLRKLFHGD
jgi:hypothetical protein